MTCSATTSFKKKLLLIPVLFCTGFAFALFGLGGLIFYFLWATFAVIYKTQRQRHLVARKVVTFWFYNFIRLIEKMGLVKVSLKNKELLFRPGLILVANHPTLIDVVCLLGLIPKATTVVKANLLKNPFLMAPIKASGFIPNNIGPDAFEIFKLELEAGSSFLIFPEGTRTPISLPEGSYPKIHRGVAALAIQTQRALTPVRITASPRWLTKEVAWWHLPEKPMELTIEVLEDIPTDEYIELFKNNPSKATRRLSKILLSRLFD